MVTRLYLKEYMLALIRSLILSSILTPRWWLGIRGTHFKSSIQDIVDEVAPIKKAPHWG